MAREPMPDAEPFPGKRLLADGWEYRNLPSRMTPEYWNKFLTIMGKENYHVLAVSRGVDAKGEDWVRGQFMISPAGFERLLAYLKANE